MDLSEETSRGDAAVATWIYQRRRVAAGTRTFGRDLPPRYTRVRVQNPLDASTIIGLVGGVFSFIGLGAWFVYVMGEKLGALVCGGAAEAPEATKVQPAVAEAA